MTRKVVFAGGDDDVIPYTNAGSLITAGSMVKLSHTMGIALDDIATGETKSVAIGGVVQNVPKATGSAWVQGEKLLWDVSAGPAFAGSGVAAASGDATGAAIAWLAAASGDTTGTVKLTPGNTTLTP